MKILLICFSMLSLSACADLRAITGNSKVVEIWLTEDFYEWHCNDRGNIIVSTETYECSKTGLHYIIAEAQMYDGEIFKINLKNDWACIEPHWEETIPISVFDYHCEDPGIESDIDGVTLTAYADEGTWASVISED